MLGLSCFTAATCLQRPLHTALHSALHPTNSHSLTISSHHLTQNPLAPMHPGPDITPLQQTAPPPVVCSCPLALHTFPPPPSPAFPSCTAPSFLCSALLRLLYTCMPVAYSCGLVNRPCRVIEFTHRRPGAHEALPAVGCRAGCRGGSYTHTRHTALNDEQALNKLRAGAHPEAATGGPRRWRGRRGARCTGGTACRCGSTAGPAPALPPHPSDESCWRRLTPLSRPPSGGCGRAPAHRAARREN